ncbi:MAG: glucoamylase family protein [Candidatus Promineifilaceae bacterium]|nr:glucoamylase family protein [Candidatus Promineifilaceae bacterium]
MTQAGALEQIGVIEYVITLDADTVLPRDGAARLCGALAHPLNRARFAPQSRRIVAGYTILQPRTEIKPTSANQSIFTQAFTGDAGLDLYTRAVSDVYQDLFGEGIFVGKGIYDVDAFERSLAGRVPENSLLSHDLFEGIHGRAGLVTDIVLYEEYPPHYLIHVRRSHRWMRGDWQLLPWLLPLVPTVEGWRPNPLSLIDRWKVVDNLRRSLLAVSLVLLLLAGWTFLPGSPVVWTVVAVMTPAVALLTGVAMVLVRRLGGASWSDVLAPLQDSALRWLLFISFLPYEAVLKFDAVLTTLSRLLITRRHLLQWTTAAHTVRLFGEDVSPAVSWRNMISNPLLAVAATLTIFLLNPAALRVAFPLLLSWFCAPYLSYIISRPLREERPALSDVERRRLQRLARRTWYFYEQFVGPEDNWLPPDHFQEAPKGVVAHRTSPTNTGLYLLSALAAYDFGYTEIMSLALRVRSTLETLKRLDRHQGHFLNWIDTRTLAPLPPRYISAVDSGNLAGALVALAQGFAELPGHPVWRRVRWQGLLDTVGLLEEAAATIPGGARGMLSDHVEMLRREVHQLPEKPQAHAALMVNVKSQWLPELDRRVVAKVENAAGLVEADTLQLCRLYTERIHYHFQGMEREMETLLPWLAALPEAPPLFEHPESAPPAVVQKVRQLRTIMDHIPTLRELPELYAQAEALLADVRSAMAPSAVHGAESWCGDLVKQLAESRRHVQTLLEDCAHAVQDCNRLVEEMDFGFLFDNQRQVFHIGYNLDAGVADNNYYDLLASEARVTSLLAIAKNDVPLRHWLHLGRPVTDVDGRRTLLSWSGTMFEYLMPPLLLRTYADTLLTTSVQAAVARQIAYGEERGVPWGISESGFYTFDADQNYQYRAFGVPGLGFKRGLGDDLVISPYASLLALPFHPRDVIVNLDAFERRGMMGRYGLYEAVDFTQARLPRGAQQAIVRSYMAHHQGMIMLALANTLHGNSFVNRFHSDPRIGSVELLLQEIIPARAPIEQPEEEEATEVQVTTVQRHVQPWSVPLQTPMPSVHFLSNGDYDLLITNSGGGFSRWRGAMLTRWRPDTVQDDWGQWLYVQDEATDAIWSVGAQPTGALPEEGFTQAEILYHPHAAEFRRRDHDIATQMEVVVAPRDDVEIRRVTVHNSGEAWRSLRLTSYAEVVLTDQETDRRHPAFAKLFVESEYLPELNALLFRRRPRAAHENPLYLLHLLLPEEGVAATGAHEADRRQFLGRGRTDRNAQAIVGDGWLTGTTGPTLDSVMALGQRVELAPHATTLVALITVAADSRERALELAAAYRSWAAVQRTFAEARMEAEGEVRRLELDSLLLEQAQQLLSLLFYPHPIQRPEPALLATNELGQPGLWSFGISGDNPIILVRLKQETEGELLQDLLRIHTFWRNRNLEIDLVVLNLQESNYGRALQGFIHRLIQRAGVDEWLNRQGGLFVVKADQITAAEQRLLQTAARVVLDGTVPSLGDHLANLYRQEVRLPSFMRTADPATLEEVAPVARPRDLQFDNGYGGFSADGREYVIYLEPGMATPAPWINVIANPDFGFLVSESGAGYTWALNSGENRLTSWRNDPISDLPSEVVYLRDEETAEVWTPTPQPTPANAAYLIRHGAGYTVFEHNSHGLRQRLRLFASSRDPVKVVELTLENARPRARRITATFYAEMVLGTGREQTQQYIVPEYVEAHNALLFRNRYNTEFAARVAFVAASREPHGLTADRAEFLGRLFTMRWPAAIGRIGLDNRVAAGLDPCAAIQLHVDLQPGESETVYFLVGQGATATETMDLLQRYQERQAVTQTWDEAREMWEQILSAVQVETPEPAMDLLLNRWLLYQALSCRIWGRSALYQSSGAYGFRDQLQDVMALVHARPDQTRDQIIRAAHHQFEAGDVLHWWHPPSGRGVRTRIRDDLLWLPFVTAHYVATTGDTSILDVETPWLIAAPLEQEEEERYGMYESTVETGTIFEHCRRAIENGSTEGRHGLPLIGGGDWNDGMNRVGIEGQGESIWLGWFLYTTLTAFADLSERVGREEVAARYRTRAQKLQEALELNGWDGEWYLRGYYDDGAPLGSHTSEECHIDAIAQSWAVLSGAGDPARARQALAAVEKHLIRWEDRLLLLFTPPFDETNRDPGYIKGYLPGIRENGGQYTHAALWTIWAFARLGKGRMATDLFRLTNPICRADSRQKADHYKVEPYVIVADVYGVPPHIGRGGWTWYTGSSSWMYRLGLEAILGLRREGDALRLDPHVDPGWPGYTIRYRHGQTLYRIRVENPDGVSEGVVEVLLDGNSLADGRIPLIDDGERHDVRVVLGDGSV